MRGDHSQRDIPARNCAAAATTTSRGGAAGPHRDGDRRTSSGAVIRYVRPVVLMASSVGGRGTGAPGACRRAPGRHRQVSAVRVGAARGEHELSAPGGLAVSPDGPRPILERPDSAVREYAVHFPCTRSRTCEQCRTDPTTPTSSELRADIRRLGDLLGETLVRQEGPELLDLVEKVRAPDPRATARPPPSCCGDTDLETAAKLVRAFSTYFHLANVTEQVHRGRELRARRAAEGGLLARTGRPAQGRRPRAPARRPSRNLNVRPGLHRPPHRGRPPLGPATSCARIADTAGDPASSTADRRRHDPRLAENIDLLWQTDELRVVPPRARRRGPQRHLLPRRAARRRRRRRPGGPRRRAGARRRRAARRHPPAHLRHLDRRRPRRQPQRHPRRSPGTC